MIASSLVSTMEASCCAMSSARLRSQCGCRHVRRAHQRPRGVVRAGAFGPLGCRLQSPRPSALADVDEAIDGADDASPAVPDRFDIDQGNNTRAVGALEYDFEIADGYAGPQYIVHRVLSSAEAARHRGGGCGTTRRTARRGSPSLGVRPRESRPPPVEAPEDAIAVADVGRRWQQIPKPVREFQPRRLEPVMLQVRDVDHTCQSPWIPHPR